MIEDAATSLSAFQIEVSRLFFDLPACRGFLLAGGGALAAQVFSDMMGGLGRFVDADLPVQPSEVGMVREFFRVWREELAGG